MKLRSLVTVGVVIAAGQVLTACGDTADQDLCTQYAGLLAGSGRVAAAGSADRQG